MRLLITLFSCLLVALPWLNPFAGGPSAAMVPWLVSLACVGALGLLMAWRSWGSLTGVAAGQRVGLSGYVRWFFAANALYFGLRTFAQISTGESGAVAGAGAVSEVAATLLAWGCVALMAWVGAGVGMGVPRLLRFSVQALAATWLVVALVSVGMALLQYLQLEQWAAPWVSHSADGVAYANLRQRNQFATLCGVGLLALLYLQQTTHSPPDTAPDALRSAAATLPDIAPRLASASLPANELLWQRAWPWLAVAVLALGNGLSSSRTGAVQWVLIVVAVVCWRGSLRAQVKRLGVAALALYAAVVAIMPLLASAVGNPSTGLWGRAQEAGAAGVTGDARWWLYSNVLDLIALKPWLGWGWRELAYAHYSTPFKVRFTELLDNAHNLPLHLAVELGVPFAMLFCGAVVVWIVKSRPWREANPARQLAWGVLTLLGVHSMVEYPLWYGPFLMTLGLCVGLLQSRPLQQSLQPLQSPPTPPLASRAERAKGKPTLLERRLAYMFPGIDDENSQFPDVDIQYFAIKIISISILLAAVYLAYDYHRASQVYLSPEVRSAVYADNALGVAQRSTVFAQQARFAELVTTPVTPQTAARVLSLAADLVHYSPEPRVIEPLIESAVMLHFDDVAMFHISRYKAMYPKDYAAWSALR